MCAAADMALGHVLSVVGGCDEGGGFGWFFHDVLVVWIGGSPILKGCFELLRWCWDPGGSRSLSRHWIWVWSDLVGLLALLLWSTRWWRIGRLAGSCTVMVGLPSSCWRRWRLCPIYPFVVLDCYFSRS